MPRTKILINGFWDRVDEVILSQELTKAEIARRMKCNRKTLYARDSAMNPLYLARFCTVTGADANYLLGIRRAK